MTTFSFAQNQGSLAIGDKAPVFRTLADDGKLWDVSDYIGKKKYCGLFLPGGHDRWLHKTSLRIPRFQN